MIVHHLSYPLSTREPSHRNLVLSIGDFDGVHLGHREVLGRSVRIAGETGGVSAVMTFHPHPREVLGLEQYARYLTPLEDKLREFEQLGLEEAYVVQFDKPFSSVSPERFVDEVLIPLGVSTVIVGFNFTFGHKGAGTPELLQELAGGRFAVEIVQPYVMQEDRVSSTLIRASLQNGQPELAKRYLGRPFRFAGTVVHGEGRGRTIGVPTANVELIGPYIIPKQGVYAVSVLTKGSRYGGVMNIGKKPTFHGDEGIVTIEIHLFDFTGDLYGSIIEVELHRFIRSERRFSSVDELIAQINNDRMEAKQHLLSDRIML
ncbi:bifunctional riboflavin kinase/FAD synthetase [Paenibacillus turpanensis]|uniref:bifunctional riboflavin kinase/FAD synthetase n=1 Tax=Paenibacillus turpanensis TaxID=2689078 RepID=UPI001407BF1F|nr:bifunctional riboflavin kinase/FAD synthetase [Paenibacillus turpanensis]